MFVSRILQLVLVNENFVMKREYTMETDLSPMNFRQMSKFMLYRVSL